uniref:CHAT domain-containing protein n=1 Tax=Chrysotila carterae TaxID=13221 RepID=A0A7S4BRV7_CHRCT
MSSAADGTSQLQHPYADLLPFPQEAYGQLLLLTNEGTRQDELKSIQGEIDAIIKASGDQSVIQIRRVSRDTLLAAVKKHAKAVVVAHFSGHGVGGFAVHNEASDQLVVLPSTDLAEEFRSCKQMRCVFFNMCLGAAAADAFMEKCPAVNFVVYFARRVTDLTAHDFAGRFYRKLRETRNVEEAFSVARRMLTTCSAAHYDGQLPSIRIRKGTEPPQLQIGPPREPLRFAVELPMSLSATEANRCAADIVGSIQRELRKLELEVRPEEIIVEEWRTRWELRLENSCKLQITKAQAQMILNRLREIYGQFDVDFVLESWRYGFLILCLQSSLNAFQKLQAVHAQGRLSTVLGMKVLDLTAIGVEATIAAPGYVFTRICAYRTSCIERELEPKIRIGSSERSPAEQSDAAADNGTAPSRAAEKVATSTSAPLSRVLPEQAAHAPALSGGDGGVSSSGKRPREEVAVEQQARRKQRGSRGESEGAAIGEAGESTESDRGSAKGMGGTLDTEFEAATRAGVREATKKALDELRGGATTLDLSDKGVGPDDVAVLAEALKVNKSLKSLDLAYNKLGADAMAALWEALKVNTSITNLVVIGNNFGPGGIAALGEVLEVNPNLTTLNIAKNSLGPEGMASLKEALMVNTSVTNLNVADNSLGTEGMVDLGEALKVNTSVTDLNVADNSLGPDGMADLGEALKVNTSINDAQRCTQQSRARRHRCACGGAEGQHERDRFQRRKQQPRARRHG